MKMLIVCVVAMMMCIAALESFKKSAVDGGTAVSAKAVTGNQP